MSKKILTCMSVAVFTMIGLATVNQANAARHWKGPEHLELEEEFYPRTKRVNKRAAQKQDKIDKFWDRRFRKYKGVSSADMKD